MEVLALTSDGPVTMIRLDDYQENPHYHAPVGVWHGFDRGALGEPLAWFIEQVQDHLPAWLDRSGFSGVVPAVDLGDDSVVELMASHQIGFDRISGIRIGVCETSRVNHGLGYEPGAAADDSNATQAAQLSIRFATAVAARHGPAVLADLGPGQFNDPEVLDLARRVDVYREPKQERESWMNWGCVTTITTTDRESFTIEMPAPVGSPRNPMTDADVEQKFHGLVDPVLGRSRADAIVEAVWHLEDTRPGAELLALTIA